MSYKRTAENRQKILDHLHANPLQSANRIAIEAGISRLIVQGCVKFMTERGEIEKIGAEQKTRYRAIAKSTISAEAVIAEMQTKRQQAGIESNFTFSESGIVSKPGYYSQRGGGWQAHSGQGGQGACRRVVGVVSGLA